MRKNILWILVLPVSTLSFIAADFVVPIILNAFIFTGTYFRMSPFVEWLTSKFMGNHLSLFITYFMAVYGGSIIAPEREKASIILGLLFLLLRISQTASVFTDSSFTEDTPTQFVIGSIFTFLGTILSIYLINKKGKKLLLDSKTIINQQLKLRKISFRILVCIAVSIFAIIQGLQAGAIPTEMGHHYFSGGIYFGRYITFFRA